MLILSGLVVVLIVGILWYRMTEEYTDSKMCSTALIAVSVVLLLTATVALPINRMDATAIVIQFESLRASVDSARQHIGHADNSTPTSIETATLTMKIAEANQWMVGVQYWNRTMFDIWIPDTVEELQPIR